MSNIDFKINGEIVGEERIKKIYESSPKVFTLYMMKYLRWSGNKMIGSKKKDGAVRQAMAHLHNKIDNKPYERKFINMLFNYKIYRDNLILKAGLIYDKKKKIHEIGELLESGWSTYSKGYMILPNYKEFNCQRLKYFGRFQKKINAKDLRYVYSKGVILYFDKISGKLLFTGVKNVTVKSKYNFNAAIESVRPSVEKKANNMLAKAIESIELEQRFSKLDDEE